MQDFQSQYPFRFFTFNQLALPQSDVERFPPHCGSDTPFAVYYSRQPLTPWDARGNYKPVWLRANQMRDPPTGVSLPQVLTYAMNSSLDHDSVEKKQESFVDLPQFESVEDKARYERRTMRSVDLHIIPIVSLLYSFALVDRINLGSARTAGMGPALHLEIGARFSIATVMYFIPYILLQIPGNLVVRKFGPRNYLAFCAIGWGAVQLGMGFVTTWQHLTLCRVLLGMFEASFFPAVVYIISSWYTRYESVDLAPSLRMFSAFSMGNETSLAGLGSLSLRAV
ncbi:major facilitator superfamily domain-containing protein [Mycena vitilis]|nr:major facilitator superfamily domain-containing protein [Mycena vitilis]